MSSNIEDSAEQIKKEKEKPHKEVAKILVEDKVFINYSFVGGCFFYWQMILTWHNKLIHGTTSVV